jgi:hypothetical protein
LLNRFDVKGMGLGEITLVLFGKSSDEVLEIFDFFHPLRSGVHRQGSRASLLLLNFFGRVA